MHHLGESALLWKNRKCRQVLRPVELSFEFYRSPMEKYVYMISYPRYLWVFQVYMLSFKQIHFWCTQKNAITFHEKIEYKYI